MEGNMSELSAVADARLFGAAYIPRKKMKCS
jgi:hypothetical protein